MRWRGTWPAALALAAIVGCGGPKGPATYPAGGKVVDAAGEPWTGGTVQFQPPDGGPGAAVAEIQKDGTFTLYTILDGRKAAGALAGPYRVVVLPPLGRNQAAQPRVSPVTLPGLYVVKPEGDNDFTFTVPRSGRP